MLQVPRNIGPAIRRRPARSTNRRRPQSGRPGQSPAVARVSVNASQPSLRRAKCNRQIPASGPWTRRMSIVLPSTSRKCGQVYVAAPGRKSGLARINRDVLGRQVDAHFCVDSKARVESPHENRTPPRQPRRWSPHAPYGAPPHPTAGSSIVQPSRERHGTCTTDARRLQEDLFLVIS